MANRLTRPGSLGLPLSRPIVAEVNTRHSEAWIIVGEAMRTPSHPKAQDVTPAEQAWPLAKSALPPGAQLPPRR